MRNASILAVCMLLLAGCTPLEIDVTTAVPLHMKVEEVKGSKIIFSMDPEDPNAWYGYGLVPSVTEEYKMTDRELARFYAEGYLESYEIVKKDTDRITTFLDMYYMRGSRTIRATTLGPDTEYRLVVYQINPKTFEVMDNIQSATLHTLPIDMEDMDFAIKMDNGILDIVPSDPDRVYYWDYDLSARIYDNYLWSYGYFYHLLDMLDEYGFMGEMYSQGGESYNLKADHLVNGTAYTLVAGATEDGEITSPVTVVEFTYYDDGIKITDQYKQTGEDE